MRRIVLVCVLIFLGTVPLGWLRNCFGGESPVCIAEMPSLEELKEAALKYNLTIKTKEEELKAIAAQQSLFNALRLSSSYNFETDSRFFGVTVSLPFGFWGERAKYLKYKQQTLEEERQAVLFEIEDLYLRYQTGKKDIEAKEAGFREAELKLRIAKIAFKHNRITQEELLKTQTEFKQQEVGLFKTKEETKAQEERLYALSGIRRDN